MLMDISKWILYNPKIVRDHTSKKFYGRYLYRLIVFCPAGRAVDSKRSVVDELEHRRVLSVNIKGWWGERLAKNIDKADPEFLERMKALRHQRLPNIKMRIEEPRLQLYANSEEELTTIIDTYFSPKDHVYIENITGPEDDTSKNLLDSGAIIRKKNLGYSHKVVLRDGKYSKDVKDSILNYLNSLGPEMVKIPNGFLTMLTKSSSYMWNGYFYTNDPSVTTFIALISPGLVSNIHELVVVADK